MAIYSEFSHEKWWPLSIVTLVYQRVMLMAWLTNPAKNHCFNSVQSRYNRRNSHFGLSEYDSYLYISWMIIIFCMKMTYLIISDAHNIIQCWRHISSNTIHIPSKSWLSKQWSTSTIFPCPVTFEPIQLTWLGTLRCSRCFAVNRMAEHHK